MILYPPAKINIGLNVVGKREDGYHELETVMVSVPLFDVLEIIPQDQFEWKQSGLLIEGNDATNLCIKAYQLMQSNYSIGNVYMHLRKQIPMGAGLGGGSADAAFVIKGVNELFQLNIDLDTQRELAAQLGSDCPFFIDPIAQLATGRGERLTPIELILNNHYLVLIKPEIHINTSQAYTGVYISGDKGNLVQNLQQPLSNWKNLVKNDFERHIFELHPRLADIKNTLYNSGAVYAGMSGSGSTMYGIFSTQPDFDASKNPSVIYNGPFFKT